MMVWQHVGIRFRFQSQIVQLLPTARMTRLRVFISSVQKELELERTAIAGLVTTDPFLLQHCEPVLFEKEPPPPHPASQPYLGALRACQVYILIIATEYGPLDGALSATHHEYRLAQELKLPTLVFLKGHADRARQPETTAFLKEIKSAGHTYRRFHDREDLKPEILRALARTLADDFGIQATTAEVQEGEHLIDVASPFEATPLRDVPVESLVANLVDQFNRRTGPTTIEQVSRGPGEALHTRGLAVRGEKAESFFATSAAFVLFAPRPADRFPQCEILVDAYDDKRVSGRPKGQLNVNAPLPVAVEQVIKFIDDHTLHPRRVVGLNNVRLDEYPIAALREALVNAGAHRSYEDASRKIAVRVFSDRIEVASPGYPPRPLTLAKLRRGDYRACSRNPLIAQALATLDKMEQRGSGFARMRDAMLNHGLGEPQLGQQDGFFVVTFTGPAGDLDRIKTPAVVAGPVTPAIEAQLNERQRKILIEAQRTGRVTSGWVQKRLKVVRDTANRDLAGLVRLGLLEAVGKGRAAHYTPAANRG